MTIVVNRDEGLDVIHPAGLDQCSHDADGRQLVDLLTARALVDTGQATVCHHCGPLPEPTETAP